VAILITGGAGYIGSHMVLAALDAGESVVVLDNLSTGFETAVDPRAVSVQGDVADADLLRSVIRGHGVTEVLHFAASVVVPESISNPVKYYRNNTAATLGLLAVLAEEGVARLVFSSTAAVYGNVGDEPVSEDAPLSPIAPYGASKMMSERMVQDVAAAHGFDYAILRYFNVAGADPQGRAGQSTKDATHLVKVACEAALGIRDRISVFGRDYDTHDGTCIRDYIHVSDLADAHLAVLNYLRGGGKSDIFNCGYGKMTSVQQILDAVQRISGKRMTILDAPRREGDAVAVVADPAKLKSRVGWQPKHDSLDEIVSTALAWEKRRLLSEAS
jgi:UDP-glucose 4-epimerase